MKDLNPSVDENRLWQICFPYTFAACNNEGVYIVCSPEEMLKRIELMNNIRTAVDKATARLDMAICYLWPYVADLFVVDFFPHRLAAATDLLRAVDFGEGKDLTVAALARELAGALDNLEKTYAAESNEAGLAAAEESECFCDDTHCHCKHEEK